MKNQKKKKSHEQKTMFFFQDIQDDRMKLVSLIGAGLNVTTHAIVGDFEKLDLK